MPADNGPVWGCVLIGGRSRRMGRPKHLIEAGGCSWLERTVTLIGHCVERVVIAGPGDLPATLVGTEHLADAAGVAGPLAGILGDTAPAIGQLGSIGAGLRGLLE